MIIQQCASCLEKGKKYYCNNCLKSPDFFDIYQYNNIKNRFDKGRLVGRIKAFTWHDATEHVKNRFFFDVSKQKLNINCEKDFAYVEWNSSEYPAVDIKERQGNFVGYKIYLNKELNGSEPSSSLNEDQKFSDLTIVSSGIINNDNKNIVSATGSNTYDKQQQTIASTIRPSQKKPLAPNTPTMITRVAKQEKQEEEEEEQNSLRNRMSRTT
jgi:hypothetical protein